MTTNRIHLLPSHNAWFSFIEWSFLPVVFDMEPSDCLAAPKHGWLGRPARLMRLEQFPFDLHLPLSCQFTLFLRFYPQPPAATFTSAHILHSHHWHNSSKLKKKKKKGARPRSTGLLFPSNNSCDALTCLYNADMKLVFDLTYEWRWLDIFLHVNVERK